MKHNTQYCSTGITSGKPWSRTDRGTCQWGCCKSDGTDRGWTQYCSTGFTKGTAWTKPHSGKCGQYNGAGCCNDKGHDVG